MALQLVASFCCESLKEENQMNRYHVHRNSDFYAILDTTVQDAQTNDHKLVINGSLFDRAYAEIEEEGITAEEWILRHQADELRRYEETGLTVWDRYNATLV